MLIEAPSREEVILGSRALDGRSGISIDVDPDIPFIEPIRR